MGAYSGGLDVMVAICHLFASLVIPSYQLRPNTCSGAVLIFSLVRPDLLHIDTIRHLTRSAGDQQEPAGWEQQIKASYYDSSYLVGFQTVSTGFSAAALAKAVLDSIELKPEIVSVIVFYLSSLLAPRH